MSGPRTDPRSGEPAEARPIHTGLADRLIARLDGHIGYLAQAAIGVLAFLLALFVSVWAALALVVLLVCIAGIKRWRLRVTRDRIFDAFLELTEDARQAPRRLLIGTNDDDGCARK